MHAIWRPATCAVASLLLALVLLPAAGAGAATPPTIAARAAVPIIRVGLTTYVVGHVDPPGSISSVVVQRQVDGRWLDRATSGPLPADGSFKVAITPSQVGTYTLRVRSAGGTVVSPTFTLPVVPPPSITASLSASSAPIRTAVTISGRVQPVGATPRVVSQRLIGGRWVDRDAAAVGPDGRFRITIHPSEVARYHLRVRSAQGTVRSPAMRMTTYTGLVDSVYDTGSARLGERVVALTFDDGPHPTATPRVLDVLARHQVKGTFFVVGRSAATWPDPVRRAVREGHRIANHSWSHPFLTSVSDAEVRGQLQQTQDQISRLGSSSICVRPPYGAHNSRVRNLIVSQVRSSTVMWSVDPGDWQGLPASSIVSRTMAQVRPGSIILLHDSGRSSTIEALDQMIPALKRAGYGFRLIC